MLSLTSKRMTIMGRFSAAMLAGMACMATALAIPVVADAADSGKAVDMYRLYNPHSGEHFYTGSTTERDGLSAAGWRYEGIGWASPEYSDTPVYRLYNPNASDHHYTTSLKECNDLVAAGWRYEGIGWYSSDTDRDFPVYRQYNPNAKSGAHNYTLSEAEAAELVNAGWREEGIGWYAIGSSSAEVQEPDKPVAPPEALPDRKVIPGSICGILDVGQQGTALGRIYVCSYQPGNLLPHWYPQS